MEVHIRKLGAVSISLGIVSAVIGVLYFTVLDRESLLADYLPTAVTFVWVIVMCVLAIPHLIAGMGLMRLKPWSRPLGTVLSTFSLLNLPLGTAVGLYGLWVLMSPEADEVFSPRFER